MLIYINHKLIQRGHQHGLSGFLSNILGGFNNK